MIARVLFVFILLFSTGNIGAQSNTIPLVDQALLEKAGLKSVFQTALSVKSTEKLATIKLVGDKIYALTSTNYLFCIDRRTGSPSFSRQITVPDYPVLAPQLYDSRILISSGSDLIDIDLTTGIPVTTTLPYKAACAPLRNSSYLYFPGVDKRLHVFDRQKNLHLFDVAADNDMLMTSVVATPESVVFATIAGNIVCIHAASPSRIWQTDLPDKVTAPMVRDGNSLYIGCHDTYLYKLKLSTGQIQWKHQFAGMLSQSAVVTDQAVFQYITNHGLTAIDKTTGSELWTVADGVSMLAQSAKFTFVMTTDRNCAIIDNSTGKETERLNFAQTCLQAPNTTDDLIYVADQQGRLACYGTK